MKANPVEFITATLTGAILGYFIFGPLAVDSLSATPESIQPAIEYHHCLTWDEFDQKYGDRYSPEIKLEYMLEECDE